MIGRIKRRRRLEGKMATTSPQPTTSAGAGGVHSVKQGKVDSLNGRRGMVVSLDVEECERTVELFGFARIPGDDGPGELVQSFDQGMCWNVRWTRTGVRVWRPDSRCSCVCKQAESLRGANIFCITPGIPCSTQADVCEGAAMRGDARLPGCPQRLLLCAAIPG